MAEIVVTGINELDIRLASLRDLFDPVTERALKEVAADIRDEAKNLCPVDTGSLKASIRVRAYARVAGHTHLIGVSAGGYITNPKTGRKVDYASFVEYGTSRNRAQPYMRPAFLKFTRKLTKIIRDGLRR